MNAALDWINHASIGWWNYIVHTSWQAAVVGAVLLLAVHLLGRRWPAPLRYALLVLALLKFACPPLLPVPTGLFTHFAPPSAVLPIVQERKPAQASDPQSDPILTAATSGDPAASRPRIPGWFKSVHWTGWLMVLHGLGTTVIIVSVARQAAKLRAVARAARPVRGGSVPEEYRDLAIQLGLYRIPDLAVSDEVDGPMAFGAKRPAIMLPGRIFNRLSSAELRAVLAHELAHCQRGDLWLNWVQLMLVAVWWFHPVLWLINRSVREVREDCCDDLLLARGVISNDAYCDVLLRAASEVSPALPLSAALGFGEGIHPLGRRLARITDWDLQRSEGVSTAGAIAVLLAAAVFFPGARSSELAPQTNSQSVSGPASARAPGVAPRLGAPREQIAPVRSPSPAERARTGQRMAGGNANRFGAALPEAQQGFARKEQGIRVGFASVQIAAPQGGPMADSASAGQLANAYGALSLAHIVTDYPPQQMGVFLRNYAALASGHEALENNRHPVGIFVPPPNLGVIRIGGRIFWPAGVHVRVFAGQPLPPKSTGPGEWRIQVARGI